MTDVQITTPMMDILISLLAGPLHGYSIAKRIVEMRRAGEPLGPATLYTSIQKLLHLNMIKDAEVLGSDARRKNYELTPEGRDTAAQFVAQESAFLQKAKDDIERNSNHANTLARG